VTTAIIVGAFLALPLTLWHVTINEFDRADRIAKERERISGRRTAADGMSWEDTMKYIDDTLAAGEREPVHPDAGRRLTPEEIAEWDTIGGLRPGGDPDRNRADEDAFNAVGFPDDHNVFGVNK